MRRLAIFAALAVGSAVTASADTISFNFGGTGTASGTATIGSTPTISARWAQATNLDQLVGTFPSSGTVSLTGLTLTSVVANSGQFDFFYSTATNGISFTSTNPYSAGAVFTDPVSVKLNFNPTSPCAVSSNCAGNFTIGGDVLYTALSSSLANALGIGAIPPSPSSLGTLTITFKGTLTLGARGEAIRWLAGGSSPVFSGGSTFDTSNNPVPEPSTYALMGSALAGLAAIKLRRK